MTPTSKAVTRLREALRLETPLLALYDATPTEEFEPLVRLRGSSCCFSYYTRWLRGETLVAAKAADPDDKPRHGCPAALRFLGLDERGTPDWMANKLTDGEEGPGRGEGLKASPELAKDFLDGAETPSSESGFVLLGPLRLERWDAVRSVTFFVDPDRLSALITLASYWSSDADQIGAPFSSGCGLLWRDLEASGDKALIACTDLAMRKYLPPQILGFTVSASRFAQLLEVPDDSFLRKSWWKQLLDYRAKYGDAAFVD
ncbi:MAG: hypothetical protein CSA24_00570 [Deltaproteobacteria bacterium]|nr:MAG: hypothetical protein CSA24_00570 [Deltaproteobacteria bacterium]